MEYRRFSVAGTGKTDERRAVGEPTVDAVRALCYNEGIKEKGRRLHAEIAQILSIRCSAEQLFRGGREKFHFAVRHFPAGAGAGTGAGLSIAGAQKPPLYADARRRILLSKEPDPDGGL